VSCKSLRRACQAGHCPNTEPRDCANDHNPGTRLGGRRRAGAHALRVLLLAKLLRPLRTGRGDLLRLRQATSERGHAHDAVRPPTHSLGTTGRCQALLTGRDHARMQKQPTHTRMPGSTPNTSSLRTPLDILHVVTGTAIGTPSSLQGRAKQQQAQWQHGVLADFAEYCHLARAGGWGRAWLFSSTISPRLILDTNCRKRLFANLPSLSAASVAASARVCASASPAASARPPARASAWRAGQVSADPELHRLLPCATHACAQPCAYPHALQAPYMRASCPAAINSTRSTSLSGTSHLHRRPHSANGHSKHVLSCLLSCQ